MNDWKLLWDDLAKLAGSAIGMSDSMRKDARKTMTVKLEKILKKMDLVSRQEFEVVHAMAKRARSEQEELKKRVAKLEGKGSGQTRPTKPRVASRRKRA